MSDSFAGPRVIPAATLTLVDEPVDPSQILGGHPSVALAEILDDGRVAVGVWQHTAGVSRDVEADEVFVVLAGRATIDVEDGPTLEVGPGDVGVLTAGCVTRWTVHEDLRKVYVAPA